MTIHFIWRHLVWILAL